MYTIVYSDYNGYPGRPSTQYVPGYNWSTGSEPPVLPTVNLYNNFSFELKTYPINSFLTSSLVENESSYAESGYRDGVSPRSTRFGYTGANVFKIDKIPTYMAWVTNGGPRGNGVAQNEKGDWFTLEALSTADQFGGGLTFASISPSSPTIALSIVTDTYEYAGTSSTTVTNWNTLKIYGSYNAAIFCYNQFDYTNDYEGTVYTAKSLFELPEKFDNLVSFIPDQRQSTTLNFYVRVYWGRSVNWGAWNSALSNADKNKILADYTNNGFGDTGYDLHKVSHTINNNNSNWDKLLQETLKRQRSLDDQHVRYGQDFPTKRIEVKW